MPSSRSQRRGALAALALAIAAAVGVAAWVAAMKGSPPHRPDRAPVPAGKQAAHQRPATGRRRPAHAAAVPILMYHVIASAFPTSPFPGLYVPPAEFAAQMRALARAGYHAVTLDQVASAWRGAGSLPTRPVVISFDNGYRSQYTRALPVLRRLHWVGDENLQLSGLPPRQGGLSSTQIRGLIAAGWELDSQGWNHADLIQLDTPRLHFQITVARGILRRRYGVRADWFCYPSGRYDAKVVAEVKAAGYVGATTVSPGWARRSDDPFRLPRLRVLAGTSPRSLLILIAAARHDPPPPSSYPPRG
jgi:peptidoglycan/xylan/chitin deacetylase (PgdA/CDA1 family)